MDVACAAKKTPVGHVLATLCAGAAAVIGSVLGLVCGSLGAQSAPGRFTTVVAVVPWGQVLLGVPAAACHRDNCRRTRILPPVDLRQNAGAAAITAAGPNFSWCGRAEGYPQNPDRPFLGAGPDDTLGGMNKPRLILPADLRLVGQDSRKLAQLKNKGELVRIRRGVYTKSDDWNSSSPAQQYGLRAAAFQALAPRQPVLCHATAARLWGLWIVGLPSKLHVVTETATSGRNNNGVMRHLGSLTNGVVQCGPFLLTDKPTTTVALVKELSFPFAVAVCDSALRSPDAGQAVNEFTAAGSVPDLHEPSWETDGPQGQAVSVDGLRAAAGRLGSRAARERTLAVINFASDLSGSAGESISRAKMFQFGFPAPVLQQPFVLRDGRKARVDFWFEEQRVVGEFDGKGKYLRADWGAGMSIQQRVMKEKAREDQIRAQGVGFVRWEWKEMMNRQQFIHLLRQAGLPQK